MMKEEIDGILADYLQKESLTSEEAEELEQWERSAPQNAVLGATIRKLAGQKEMLDQHQPQQFVYSRLQQQMRRAKRRRRLFWSSGVAASLILLIAVTWFVQFKPGSPAETTAGLIQRPHSSIVLVTSSGQQQLLGGATAREILDKGHVAYSDSTMLRYEKAGENGYEESVMHELNIPTGGEYTLILEEGTTIRLNSQSSIRYPVPFSSESREIWVVGEAYLEVAKQEHRPFIVHMEKADVRVLGTSFNVMAYKDDQNTVITLAEGSVRVDIDTRQTVLEPGHQLLLNNREMEYTIEAVDVWAYTAWTHGNFYFDAQPLETLMLQFQRWFDVSWEFRNESLKQVRYSGGFRKYDNLNHILKVIEAATDITFTLENKKVIIDRK